MSRVLINISDIVSTLAFLAAFGIVLATPMPRDRSFLRSVKVAAAVAMALYAFVGVSNTAEWTGLTAQLDRYEDYAEILFPPLVAYTVYTLTVEQRMRAAMPAQRAALAEHDLLTTIVDTSPTGIVLATREGIVTYANDPARELLFLEEHADTGALGPAAGVRIGGQRSDWTPATAALADMVNGPVLHDAVRFVMASDGTTRAISASTNPIGGAPGEAAILSFGDITERMRYRQDLERLVSERTKELAEANRRLEDANSAKREFLAKMSHELRTPLNAVIGFTGILLDGMAGPLNDEQAKQLTMVRRAGRQLLDIVSDVLDISRIETGNTTVTLENVDVCSFVDSAVESMRPYASDRSIELILDCPDDVGILHTDPGKLGQVLRNLMSNALKFTDPGGGVAVRVSGGTDGVSFAVADTGVGIPSEEIGRIFEPFHQIDTPNRMKPQGTGLGLAVSRDLAAILHGDLTVESAPGKGSTFTLILPREG